MYILLFLFNSIGCTTADCHTYSPLPAEVNKWFNTFESNTEEVLSSCYSLCSLSHTLRSVAETIGTGRNDDRMETFCRAVKDLQRVSACFEDLFEFSTFQDVDDLDDLINEDECELDQEDESCSGFEKRNERFLETINCRDILNETVDGTDSISSMVSSSNYATASTNGSIKHRLLSPEVCSDFNDVAPEVDVNDTEDVIMNRKCSELYQKLGEGNCKTSQFHFYV